MSIFWMYTVPVAYLLHALGAMCIPNMILEYILIRIFFQIINGPGAAGLGPKLRPKSQKARLPFWKVLFLVARSYITHHISKISLSYWIPHATIAKHTCWCTSSPSSGLLDQSGSKWCKVPLLRHSSDTDQSNSGWSHHCFVPLWSQRLGAHCCCLNNLPWLLEL